MEVDEAFGSIDVVVIGFAAGAPMTSDAIPILLDLVERGVIRVPLISVAPQRDEVRVGSAAARPS